MSRLATWSGWRVLALGLAWFGVFVCLVAFEVRRNWHGPAPWALSPVPNPLPEQHTDFIYSIATVTLLKAALVLLGPPGILTALWLYARHRRQP